MWKENHLLFSWQTIAVDLMGVIRTSSTGNQYILAITHCFIKLPFLTPLKKAASSSICKILEELVFFVYGVPQIILIDNDTQFTSTIFDELTRKYEIPKICSMWNSLRGLNETTVSSKLPFDAMFWKDTALGTSICNQSPNPSEHLSMK